MENMIFWIAQLVGLVALILLVISYYKENTNKILVVQIVSALLYCIHYYMLGAISGFMICFLEVLRDYGYYKTDADNYIFLISIPIYIFLGFYNYSTFIDLLPMFGSCVDGFALTKHKRFLVVGSIIAYIIWLIYDINVKSYSGILTSSLVIITNISILVFDKKLFDKEVINTHIDKF